MIVDKVIPVETMGDLSSGTSTPASSSSPPKEVPSILIDSENLSRVKGVAEGLAASVKFGSSDCLRGPLDEHWLSRILSTGNISAIHDDKIETGSLASHDSSVEKNGKFATSNQPHYRFPSKVHSAHNLSTKVPRRISTGMLTQTEKTGLLNGYPDDRHHQSHFMVMNWLLKYPSGTESCDDLNKVGIAEEKDTTSNTEKKERRVSAYDNVDGFRSKSSSFSDNNNKLRKKKTNMRELNQFIPSNW